MGLICLRGSSKCKKRGSASSDSRVQRRLLIWRFRSGYGSASLSFIARTPGHSRERFQEINQLPVIERPKDPGVKGAYKAPASRDQAVHCALDSRMFMPAGIHAIIPGTARFVMNLCYSHWQRIEARLYTLQGATLHGVDFNEVPKDPIRRAQRIGFVRQEGEIIAD